MFKNRIDVEEVASFINNCDVNTKVYVGCDSERIRQYNDWWADYITVVVIHIAGKNGCKIFGAVQRERDWEQRCDRPKMRLMTEALKVSELYLELSKLVAHDIDIHLDLNPDEMHGSSVAVNEAVGYIKGLCGVIPFVKPEAFAASYAADRYKEIISQRVA